ncbi:oxidoreductase domain protein [Gloeothece citriformis PCC 7424]|uniref:Oxidoreductase domain protein n=1 Tax=Gloeothece citriformis (strain PCC 7424) TaxID=65393 RepID=B7KAD0_GLOC7|nr:Gfo/Idh/MocA family oxidoreductase [Gloeothece citriformis]ACK72904.1 oxidoreductase domain protein [Gloeothece citriformis PCC 7424]
MSVQSSDKLGVAVIGTGFGEKIHIPGFQHHPHTEVVAVYNRDLGKAKAIADSHKIPFAYHSLEKILALKEVDGVSISTPPFLHYEMAKMAIAAGKHILLEKPMNLRAEETKELYHLAAEKGIVVTADFEFRYVPAWQLLAEYLQQDYVGKIRLIKIDWLVASRANPDREWNWYARRDKGGGALGAVGSHAFDYISWLFGSVKRLVAHLSCAIPERPDPGAGGQLKPVDADDTCMILLELENGIPCQLSISSVTYGGRGHWVEIYGEKGTLVLGSDNLKDYVHGFRLLAAPAGKPLSEIEIPKRLAFPQVFTDGRLAPFIRVVDRWVEGIETGKSLVPSLREGVYSQLLMDLTHQSNDNQCWVDVPDLDQFLAS